MLLAEKANRRVRIADEKKDEYIGMGYTVRNLDGSLVKAPDNPKKRIQELIQSASKSGLKPEEIAERLGLVQTEE